MPSPFPGMDPYLEGDLWSTVHGQLSAEIARQLTPQLRPRYLALMETRYVMETPGEVAIAEIIPDVGIAKTGKKRERGGVATISAPLELATVMLLKIPQHRIEIRDAKKRRLVTIIEVLSPSNKSGEERRAYLRKRRRILLSSAHLMEIDLLRQGKRVPMRKALPAAPYFVFLSRVEKRPVTEVWPIEWNDPLPRLPIPLKHPDPDAILDLQRAFTNVYDSCGFEMAVDYTQPPDVPLPESAAVWAAERLRSERLRS